MIPHWNLINGQVTIIENVIDLSGTIGYYSDPSYYISDVSVNLTDANSLTDLTDVNGGFEFDDISNGNCLITPSCDIFDAVVNVGDVITLQNDLIAVTELSPYQRIAADVNGDCDNSIADAVEMLRKIANIENFPTNWSFVDNDFTITDANWCAAPGYIETEFDGTPQTDLDFVAIHKGDVNMSLPIDLNATPKANGEAVGFVRIDDQIEGDNVISIPVSIKANQKIAGIELHLSFDPNQVGFLGCEAQFESMTFNSFNIENGEVHFVWADVTHPLKSSTESEILYLHFDVEEMTDNMTDITISSHAVANQDGELLTLEIQNGNIAKKDNLLPSSFGLRQNYPNPFNPTTTIELSLPHYSEYSLSIYNINGQLIKAIVGKSNAGVVKVIWDGLNNQGEPVATGIYFYKASAGDFSETKKMLMLK